jgi:hypothetical protein
MKFLAFMLSTPGRWIVWVLTYAIGIPLVMWLPWVGYAYLYVFLLASVLIGGYYSKTLALKFLAESLLGHLPPFHFITALRERVGYHEAVAEYKSLR